MTTPTPDTDKTTRIESSDERSSRRRQVTVSQFAPGTIIAGRYRIAGILGSGGMGEVYRADDTKLDQAVALKFLPARLARDPILLGRLHDEVRLGRQVAHPNVCRIYDIVDWEGAHFVAMEYVDGEDLAKLLRRIGRLAHDKAVDIARGIAAGLMAAHAKGILHRDLKPANIMIDSLGDARIMDFGLALSDDEDDGTIAGTPAYMALEQLRGEPATVQSDLYSLGLVMYELFTGKAAHAARTLPERVRDAASEITTPSSIIRDLDPAVERIILRCLSDDPAQRPRSAREIIASLPGGDPLAAAMAAGETPSPRVVAAAGTEGTLRVWQAWSLLAAVVLLMGVVVLAKQRFGMGQYARFEKSPEVLAERTSAILRALGIPRQPYANHQFTQQRNYIGWIADQVKTPSKWKRLERGIPPLTFTRFETAKPVEPGFPNTVEAPGSTRADIDRDGRLVALIAQPGQGVKPRTLNWAPLLSAAGLDPKKLTSAAPRLLPTSAIDAHVAWSGQHPDDGTPIHVEAAAWRGQPVLFRLTGAWENATMENVAFERPALTIFVVLLTTIMLVVGLLLAWRNARVGRGDRSGALRVAVFMLLAGIAADLLTADHQPSGFHELWVVKRAIADNVFWAAVVYVLYLALEPFVRRRWPTALIASSRLLSGNARDPMVGRDVLIGMVCGLAHSGLIAAYLWMLDRRNALDPPPEVGFLDALGGSRFAFGSIPFMIASGALRGFIFIVVLVTFMLILRRRLPAAIGLGLVIMTGHYIAIGGITWASITIVTMMAFVTARYGLLAIAVAQATFMASFQYPFYTAGGWQSTNLIPIAAVIGFAIWAFYTSLGGQRAFATNLLDD
ncbi:MAG: serine/threonine protein kinase [Acidobacteriota bacterium]|nr:serine/threonine protein kinase [Acidobacteriota bacterium]